MPIELGKELSDFHPFLTEKPADGEIVPSPEEAVEEWRRLHPTAQAFEEDAAAIQEALDDIAKGDHGIPFDQFDHEFRKRHNLPV